MKGILDDSTLDSEDFLTAEEDELEDDEDEGDNDDDDFHDALEEFPEEKGNNAKKKLGKKKVMFSENQNLAPTLSSRTRLNQVRTGIACKQKQSSDFQFYLP